MITMLAAVAAMTSGSACQGPDPAIVSVVSAQSTASPGVNRFTLTVTVANLGSQNQAGNVLQSVNIVLDDNKNGQKGIPPLRAGQRYTFTYDVLRAEDTEAGSTDLRFHLVQQNGEVDCNSGNDRYKIRV